MIKLYVVHTYQVCAYVSLSVVPGTTTWRCIVYSVYRLIPWYVASLCRIICLCCVVRRFCDHGACISLLLIIASKNRHETGCATAVDVGG